MQWRPSVSRPVEFNQSRWAIDQRERAGNFEESIRAAIKGFLSSVWTALPGTVQSIDLQKCTCTVQPTIKAFVRQQDGTQVWVQLPILQDVPILFPCVGSFALTLPIAVGDEVLVVFASRCIDAWWQQGGIQIQAELRMHDLSDGFAIPGPRSVPNVLQNISPNTAQLRSADGSTYVEIAQGQVVNIVAPGGLNIQANVNVTGTLNATEEITANGGHTVSAHMHGGVQTGGGETGPPTG